MSGNLGKSDLKSTCLAAGVAMAIVWFILVLRYRAAGLLGLWLCIVFIWLVIIFFNQSTYALSEAGIVAVVLNIGLSADAHVIAFERAREDLHALPRGTDPSVGLATMHNALAIALITVLEANITTLLAMVVLWGVGTGPTIEFAFTVLISVRALRSCPLLPLPAGQSTCVGAAAACFGALVCLPSRGRLLSMQDSAEQAGTCKMVQLCPPLAGVRLHPHQHPDGSLPHAPGLERWLDCHGRLLWRQGPLLRRGRGVKCVPPQRQCLLPRVTYMLAALMPLLQQRPHAHCHSPLFSCPACAEREE